MGREAQGAEGRHPHAGPTQLPQRPCAQEVAPPPPRKDVTKYKTKDVTKDVTKDETKDLTQDVTKYKTKDETKDVTKDATDEACWGCLDTNV